MNSFTMGFFDTDDDNQRLATWIYSTAGCVECAGLSQGTLKLEDLLEIYHLVRAEAMG